MYALNIREFGHATRLSALCGSAVAALLFGIGFAAERQLPYHIERVFFGQHETFGLAIYLGLIGLVFVSYLLASKQKFTVRSSLLAIGFVGAIYAWCLWGHNFVPSPLLLVLALPPLLHVLAVRFTPQTPNSDVIAESKEASITETSEAA